MSNVTSSTSSQSVGSLPSANSTARAETRDPEVDLLVVKQKEIDTLLADMSSFGKRLQGSKQAVESAWNAFQENPDQSHLASLNKAVFLANGSMELARRVLQKDPAPDVSSEIAVAANALTTSASDLQSVSLSSQIGLSGNDVKTNEGSMGDYAPPMKKKPPSKDILDM
ncbi:MAG: hypothetical protein Q7T95_06180 [Hydrogenophaga sp.]|nr:hypothetical protein [Hydrogenophaga sp.]